MDERKKNIHIRSNIYPVEPDVFTDILQISKRTYPTNKTGSTHEFISRIRGKSALKKLAQYAHCSMSRSEIYLQELKKIGVQEWQIKLYFNLDTPCGYAKPGHNPHGLIREKTTGCRCQDRDCQFFDKNTGQCGHLK